MATEDVLQSSPIDDLALEEQLRAQVEAEAATAKAAGRPSLFARASTREVIGFIRQLAILARGSHTLAAALEVLARSISNRDLATTVRQISVQVEEGVPLSDAMSDFPWYFSEITTGIVAASEASGSLGEALDQIAADLEDDQAFRNKVFDALLYPTVLMGAFVLVGWVLLAFIVPKFSELITRTGAELEGMAAVMLSLSHFINAWYGMPLLLLLFFGSIFGMRRLRSRKPLLFEAVMSRIPIIGSILLKAAMRRFTGTLDLLLRHNVALPTALGLCEKVVSNHYVARTVAQMRVNVDEGKPMSEVLHTKSRLHPVVIDMISVGEETGQLEDMLGHLVAYIRSDFERVTTRLSVMLQPAVLILIGGLFVLVFLSFLLPYFDVLTTVGTHD